MSFGSRLHAAISAHGNLCVGIDPHPALLTQWGLPLSAAGVEEFGMRVAAAAAGTVAALKPQVALFEAYGSLGFRALERVLEAASSAQILVIADAKRGDIGSTNAGYTAAWLSKDAPFVTDALTVSPYLGVHSLDQMADTAIANHKGLYVLAATSNPEASATQLAVNNGRNLAQMAIEWAAGYVTPGYDTPGPVGVVVGATVNSAITGDAWDTHGANLVPILAPGFGAQGAKLSDIVDLYGARTHHTLANVSRSVLAAGPHRLVDAITKASSELPK